ncbi:phosphonatase-like hydrolase [Enemella sp. A6]|uniref:phosphonatase-like hydrolase n=1 Tax=Enemella sp. A6 TaxID=3440152 RepID=UPI003EBB6E23
MFELVASDVAGTTVDERGHVYRMLRQAVTDRGATVSEDVFANWMGTEKRTAITNLLELGGVDADEQMIDEAYRWFTENLKQAYRDEPPMPFPGVPEAIAALRSAGVKVVLTTGFSTDIAETVIEAAGWKVGRDLDGLVPADTVAAGRPAPYLIHHAMEAMRVTDVRKVAAVGDTLADIRAARNAGVLAVGVLTGEVGREALAAEQPDFLIDSVADLPTVLQQG